MARGWINDPARTSIQNLPRDDKSEVKRMFVSRFGEDGCMIEIDYSTLEIVVQALLTGDTNLIADVQAGVDFHCKRVGQVHDITYEDALFLCKEKPGEGEYDAKLAVYLETNKGVPTLDEHKLWKSHRSDAKIYSFQSAYGAGVSKIALTTGMTIEATQALFDADKEMYPGIDIFDREVEIAIEDSSTLPDVPDDWFEPRWVPAAGRQVIFKKGVWHSPTGTRYVFQHDEAPSYLQQRGVYSSFSPTKRKNYPVQGTAGEFVTMIAGKLWRRFVQTANYKGNAFLVNTVHDCFWADAHKDVAMQVAADMKSIMTQIPFFLDQIFGIQSPVEFRSEVEIGLNMYDLHPPAAFVEHYPQFAPDAGKYKVHPLNFADLIV